MDASGVSPTSRMVTFGAALLLVGLLAIALGALVMGWLGFALPHLCAGW